MKKSTLFLMILLVLTSFSMAKTIEDFGAPRMTLQTDKSENHSSFTVVPNPYSTGINRSTYSLIAYMPDFEDPLTLTNDITIYSDDIVLINNPDPSPNFDITDLSPYLGVPAFISATKTTIIEAEYYDNGGEGYAYHDLDATMNATNNTSFRIDEGVDTEPASQGGYNVGWINIGDWLKYTVNVQESKAYIITARVAAAVGSNGANLSVLFSKNEAYSDPLTSTPKSSWQDWVWSSSDTIELEAGEQVMMINMNADFFNLDYIEIAPADVPPVSVTGITLSSTTLELIGSDTASLTATVIPENASRKRIFWTSLNSKVITVANGEVIAVGEGTDTIFATTVDGGFTAKCAVTVNKINVTGISLSVNKMELKLGDIDTLVASVLPYNALVRTVIWSTSNQSAVKVSQAGIITAREIGVANITAKTKDGSFTAVCEVTVSPPTGISNISEPRILAYPNPAGNELYISSLIPDSKLTIYNSLGRKMEEVIIKGTEARFDVSNYAKGIYFVKVNNDSVVKFVK
jgi:hypothetical protein